MRQRCSRWQAWTKGALYKVLVNRVYLGEAVHKVSPIPASTPRSSTSATWEKAHAVMAEPAHRRGAATRAGDGAPEGPDLRPEWPADVPEPHPPARPDLSRYVTRGDRGRIRQLPVTSVPAADVEGAVLDHIQKLLAAPELVLGPRRRRSERRGRDHRTRGHRLCSPSSPLSGTSCSRPSRRASFSSWSNGSTCGRTSSRCGSGPRD